VHSDRLLICKSELELLVKAAENSDGRSSPSFISSVDYVDHSAELYELPSKVSSVSMNLQSRR